MKTLRIAVILTLMGMSEWCERTWAQDVSVAGAVRDPGGTYRVKGTANVTSVTLNAPSQSKFTKVALIGSTPSNGTQIPRSGTTLPSATVDSTIASKDDNRQFTISYDITTDAGLNQSGTMSLYVDSEHPKVKNPAVEVYPGGAVDLTLEFHDTDVDAKSLIDSSVFQVNDLSSGTVGRNIPINGPPQFSSQNPRFVRLSFTQLTPGTYQIKTNKVIDTVGNPRPDNDGSPLVFVVSAGPQRGALVEYPPFLPPENKSRSEFDPGDRVDTRVVQLYYLRDARQVAEIINRNIQDLNAVGYDAAQRAAADARTTADGAIDSRRFQDEVAAQAAARTRELERRLASAREELAENQAAQTEVTRRKAEVEKTVQGITKTGSTPNEITQAITANKQAIATSQNEIGTLESELQRLNQALVTAKQGTDQAAISNAENAVKAKNDELIQKRGELTQLLNKNLSLTTLAAEIANGTDIIADLKARETALNTELGPDKLPRQLAIQQETEIAERQKVTKAEAAELRASQEQFRREVAAGLADRNSFAAGRKESIDPVAQCSISVVGTSRLQLRGPIKGLNKICRMVHQLDSPVGQVKVGIHTIQVNGEHGDRMDVVYERINREIGHSRFLVNASGQLLRRAVQEIADEVALEADAGMLPENCPPELRLSLSGANSGIPTTQEMRDRRYLYNFYGADFIGELEELKSELLNTDNKLLSLHSMDTISLAGAMFVLAHADHPVRQRILMRFQQLIAGDLMQREIEYVRALTQLDSCGHSLKYLPKRATRIDDREAQAICFNAGRTYSFPNTVGFFSNQIQTAGTLSPVQLATVKLAQALKAQLVAEMKYKNLLVEQSLLRPKQESYDREYMAVQGIQREVELRRQKLLETAKQRIFSILDSCKALAAEDAEREEIERLRERISERPAFEMLEMIRSSINKHRDVSDESEFAFSVGTEIEEQLLGNSVGVVAPAFRRKNEALQLARQIEKQKEIIKGVEQELGAAKSEVDRVVGELNSMQIFDQLIDAQEEESVELMESLRSLSSNSDNYLKRLAIAVEDDVAAQFYEPAFQRIRRVSRTWDVTLGQIETTTVLTNNRTLAKVSPAASFEFDLPKREILITEAMQGAKAVAQEYGNLLNDPTFVAGSELLRSRSVQGITGDSSAYTSIPGLNTTPEFGSELEKLIEPPAVYKFETGTGFEIRPVIQPDGSSVMYTFDYQYSTQVREPVRADEKHLGRVKRHFVHTEVQTSSYELREISRYTVALKASRTDRGVPLFEDIPLIGSAFRPLPSDESSLQTNIILGSSTIYPTVFDLMGLRWSPYVDASGSQSLSESKTETMSRRDEVQNAILRHSRREVDAIIKRSTGP